MRKKTLLVLLVVALVIIAILIINDSLKLWESIQTFKRVFENLSEETSKNHKYYYYDKEITVSTYRAITIINYLIRPLCSLILTIFLSSLIIVFFCVLRKRENLIPTEEDKKMKQQQKIELKERKRQQKILQLNAKIEKLKRDDK